MASDGKSEEEKLIISLSSVEDENFQISNTEEEDEIIFKQPKRSQRIQNSKKRNEEKHEIKKEEKKRKIEENQVIINNKNNTQNNLDKLLLRNGPFSHELFTPTEETKKFLQEICKVIILGVGGIGCEVFRNLSMLGFRNIDIIDMDTIEKTDISRSVYFRRKDIGRSKSEVVVEFMKKRFKDGNFNFHFNRLQEMSSDFYEQFHIFVSGLNSISARRWINSTLVDLVKYEENDEGEEVIDMSSVKILIDGGIEGFKGQVNMITPKVSHCFECILDLFPPQIHHNMGLLAQNPRQPEHCISYVREVLWHRENDKKIEKNGDFFHIPNGTRFEGFNPDHMIWLYQRACQRASEFGIHGVTRLLCEDVILKIIPQSPTTSSVIGSIIANECLKAATLVYNNVKNYMMYSGHEGIYSYIFKPMKKEKCNICGGPNRFKIRILEEGKKMNLGMLVDQVLEKVKMIHSTSSQTRERLTIARLGYSFLWNLKINFFKKLSLENENKTIKEELGLSEEDEFLVLGDWIDSHRTFFRLKFVK